MGFGLGIEEVDCLFESRSSTGGVVFWAPLPPYPLPPRGSGFPQESMLPPGARGLHGSELPALLLDFFLASSPASRGPEARGPGFTLYFPDARARLSGGQAFRGHSGLQVSGIPALLPPAFRGPGTMLSGFFLTSRPAFRLSGGQGPGFPPCCFSFAASLGFVCYIKIDAAGCFQQRPIIYVMSSFPFFPNFPHWFFGVFFLVTISA